MIIPFKRSLRPKMKGMDVYAVKRALIKAGYGKGIVLSRLFGRAMYADLRRFQKAHKLTVDGEYGPRTHAKLEPYFDRYGRWVYSRQRLPKPTTTKRAAVVKYAKWGAANRSRFSYAEIRPIPSNPWASHITTDCSGFATLAFKAAGAKDPNGNNYNGSGNTDTLQAHGRRVISPKPGDLVFYRNPDHVAVYIGNGRVATFGGRDGPRIASEWYRTVWDIRSYLG